MGIKHSLGKLELNGSLEDIFNIIEATGFEILPLAKEHILKVSSLDFHHRDPFDRIIIAQAIENLLTVVSKDENFKLYKVPSLWEKA